MAVTSFCVAWSAKIASAGFIDACVPSLAGSKLQKAVELRRPC
jgi:hypothetical protein